MDGGQSVSVNTKFEDAAAAWRAVKVAEAHPVDAAQGVTVENELPQISQE